MPSSCTCTFRSTPLASWNVQLYTCILWIKMTVHVNYLRKNFTIEMSNSLHNFHSFAIFPFGHVELC